MVTPLSEEDIHAYERAQESTIRRRDRFLYDSVPTQEEIVALLEKMDSIIQKEGVGAAHIYFFKQLKPHADEQSPYYVDEGRVDWEEVRDQILESCFGDDDMDGLTLVERRVSSELAAFRALMELPRKHREDF